MKYLDYYKNDLKRDINIKPLSYRAIFLYFYRKSSMTKCAFSHVIYKLISSSHGIEIPPSTSIGKGLYVGHPYNITIHGDAVIGNNVNIHKGVTIGQENRGKRKGTPIIGDRVFIGINSTIVGNIKIGDDVQIAPNSFVNCDVPSHSIVIGNPCKIYKKNNATEGYINNII